MLGKILKIIDNQVFLKLAIDINSQTNLINLHVIFEDDNQKIVGQIVNVDQEQMVINIIGEFKNNEFYPGITAKPSFKSKTRIIAIEELEKVLGSQTLTNKTSFFGYSTIYQNYKINVEINAFFNNHFSIIGNTGSGKSCSVASIFQNLFTNTAKPPIKSNIFFFDAFGEYTSAFSYLNNINNGVHYKAYTTNTNFADSDILKIPIWLLDVDDLALLLDVESPNQLPILEKTLKLVPLLSSSNENTNKYKNDIIARALQDILLSGVNSTKIRDQVIAILTKFNTRELNLESQIVQPGYVRTLKQCLYIDKTGKLQEIELVTAFIRSFINDSLATEYENNQESGYYTLEDLEEAMDFALISEGILKSEKVYENVNVLRVRLHNIINSNYKKFFEYPAYVDRINYIKDLMIDKASGQKCQLINFNINYVDDRFAKVITKVLSRILFNIASENSDRGSIPFHIIIEEAHRYVQKDRDVDVLGYNIFERITKEGRKYGVFLGLITQRPSEISETAISQCSNFLILRVLHPKDLDYIKNMVPNISNEIVQQLKNLQPGNCIAFGHAFKVPVSMHIMLPNPQPDSNNVDLVNLWY